MKIRPTIFALRLRIVPASVDSTRRRGWSPTGAVTLDAATTFSIASNTMPLTGAVNGNGGIVKTGTGRLVFSGANSNTGATTAGAERLAQFSDAAGRDDPIVVGGKLR